MLEPWVGRSLLHSLPFVLVYLCMNVGPWGATRLSACPVLCHSESGPLSLSVCDCRAAGSASGQTACPIRPTLHQSQSRHSNVSPLHPRCPSPPLLPVWMNVSFLSPWCGTSLLFDFLSVLVVRGGAVCLPTPPSWFFLPVFNQWMNTVKMLKSKETLDDSTHRGWTTRAQNRTDRWRRSLDCYCLNELLS